MFPWFMWNNIDSRDMGLWVSALPPIVRAKERTDEIKVPGKAGSLTMLEGQNVHDSYLKNCVVTVPRTADFAALLAWLSGEGKVIFSNEENRVYNARIAGEVSFDRISNTLAQATIPFFVHPHKAAYPAPGAVTISGTEGTIYNPGDIASLPIIKVDCTGSVEITIGDYIMAFSGLTEPIIVDCAAEIITTEDGEIWTGNYSGEYWHLEKGVNNITMSASCTLTITPEWRWL